MKHEEVTRHVEPCEGDARIRAAFSEKAFIAFVTAGDPTLDATERYIRIAANAGADIVEIGIPFSDPVAEGPVIQAASERALSGGVTTDKIFSMVERLRTDRPVTIPLLFMTYVNPIYVYGPERFFARCASVGIDGVIVPDVPFEERGILRESARKYGIAVVPLVAPTSEARIGEIAASAEGFLYCVSSLGVTGIRSEIKTDIDSIVKTAKAHTDCPVAVGFGISTPEQAKKMSASADGIIVGSAIVKLIAEHGNEADDALAAYVGSMKRAVVG